MAIIKIIPFPNPILRKKCKPVKHIDSNIKKLIRDMIDTMHAAPGVGLAAPQVGECLQIIVIDIGNGAFTLINPKIRSKSKALHTIEEGCLSIVGIAAMVERPSQITVDGLDKNGQKITIEADGFLATVLQHEIDHLSGIVFIDRVKDKSLIRETSKLQEEEKNELL